MTGGFSAADVTFSPVLGTSAGTVSRDAVGRELVAGAVLVPAVRLAVVRAGVVERGALDGGTLDDGGLEPIVAAGYVVVASVDGVESDEQAVEAAATKHPASKTASERTQNGCPMRPWSQ